MLTKGFFTFSPDFLQNNSKKGIFAPNIKNEHHGRKDWL